MQIIRNVPRYVNLPKFFATLAVSDNPLASTYSSDNWCTALSAAIEPIPSKKFHEPRHVACSVASS